MQVLYPGQAGTRGVDFCGGRIQTQRIQLKNTEKNPWSKERTNNKLNSHMVLGGDQIGTMCHVWEESTLATMLSLLPAE